MIHSLRMATDALKSGEVVCIFPEGQMTRIGQMLPFRRGMERIIKGVDVPIIPVNLDGVWGSIFSFAGGRFLWKFPRRIPYRSASRLATHAADFHFHGSAPRRTRPWRGSLRAPQEAHARVVAILYLYGAAPSLPFRDGGWSAAQAQLFSGAAGALVLARRLRKLWQGQEMVGVLLPPSVPGALVNFAAILMGKVRST